MNIFAGNLPKDMTEQALRELFQAYGQVRSVSIIRDRYTNQSRGFGFCEMPTQTEADAAIIGLDGKEMAGRFLDVSEALPRKQGKGGSQQGASRGHTGAASRKRDQEWRYRYLNPAGRRTAS